LAEKAEPTVRCRLLFDAYIVEVLARRRSNELGNPERKLRAIRTLAVASTKLGAGVRVPPLDFDEADRYLTDPVMGVAALWIAPVWRGPPRRDDRSDERLCPRAIHRAVRADP